MQGVIEAKVLAAIKEHGTICFALVDSEGLEPSQAALRAQRAEKCGVEAILVGGSTAIDQLELHRVVTEIKGITTKPVILFPGNITGVSPKADAILFSSLLNSDNPYFITEAQALGAFAVKKYSLETLPMGYLIIGEGGSTGFVGRARGIPTHKPHLASMYALAAQYLGMRYLYLEAGSGVTSHVPATMIAEVRKVYEGTLIVGGGIRNAQQAIDLSRAGTDILVIGSLLDQEYFEKPLSEIVIATKSQQM